MIRWLLDADELKITIEVSGEATQALLSNALADLRLVPVNESEGFVLSVTELTPDRWELNDASEPITRELKTPGDLIYHLSDRVIFHLADNLRERHCLHAAAVELGAGACVIPAQSGAGKSSLTAWLVANGLPYLTDELILIDRSHQITGVARPIQIKTPGMAVVSALLDEGSEILHGELANAITATMLGGSTGDQSPLDIGLFLFPQYLASADFNLVKLNSAEAGMRLMSNHVNARNLQDHGFRTMMKLIRETPCYSLEYGGYDKLPKDFSNQLAALTN